MMGNQVKILEIEGLKTILGVWNLEKSGQDPRKRPWKVRSSCLVHAHTLMAIKYNMTIMYADTQNPFFGISNRIA